MEKLTTGERFDKEKAKLREKWGEMCGLDEDWLWKFDRSIDNGEKAVIDVENILDWAVYQCRESYEAGLAAGRKESEKYWEGYYNCCECHKKPCIGHYYEPVESLSTEKTGKKDEAK